jgi:hypothetical protein
MRVPEEQVPMDDLSASADLSYQEYLIKIFETSERVTWNKMIKMCSVQWSHHTEEEAIWEREKYQGRDSFLGGGEEVCNTLFSGKDKFLSHYLFK